ncbi:MAG: hypothetical protein HOO96_15565 [Polyangiaceae bacterium]|nr:hypothetical protein [Polyangiaceae bacterium]
MGTINSWLTSPAFKNPADLSEDDDIRRCHNLVKAILENRDGFDVIALNEAFDEDVRTELVSLLRDEFPYIVKKVDHLPSIVGGEDSGLMLFSKLPFQTFPAVVGDGIQTIVNYESNTANYTISAANNIVPAQHLMGVGVDAGAWKSVAAVKVNQGGRRYTIAFTHMQADPGPDDPLPPSPGTIRNTRDAQLGQIKDFLAAAGAASTGDKEDTLLVGDLNVQGWPGHSSFMPPGAGPNSIPAPNAQMLASEYGVGVWGNIAGLNFFDAWRTSSPEDTGITNIATGEPSRFDYILMNGRGHYTAGSPTLHPPSFVTATAPFGVPQWTRRMLETVNSDHIGVATVLGPKGPRSTPALAEVVVPGGDPRIRNTFASAGENHWYRFNRPGTYSFGFADSPGDLLAYDVFAVRDMAHPLAAYDPIPGGNITLPPAECAGTGVCNFNRTVFFSGTSPFYVRIYSPRGRTTGTYNFLAKVHDCSSPDFACALKAGAPPLDPSPPEDRNFTGFFTYRALATGTTTPQALSLRVGNPAQQGLDVRITRIGTQVFSAQGFNSSYTFGFPEVSGADYFLSV